LLFYVFLQNENAIKLFRLTIFETTTTKIKSLFCRYTCKPNHLLTAVVLFGKEFQQQFLLTRVSLWTKLTLSEFEVLMKSSLRKNGWSLNCNDCVMQLFLSAPFTKSVLLFINCWFKLKF